MLTQMIQKSRFWTRYGGALWITLACFDTFALIQITFKEYFGLIDGFRYWQSICQIREFYGFPAAETIFALSKKRFHQQLITHVNSILRFLSSLETSVVE